MEGMDEAAWPWLVAALTSDRDGAEPPATVSSSEMNGFVSFVPLSLLACLCSRRSWRSTEDERADDPDMLLIFHELDWKKNKRNRLSL